MRKGRFEKKAQRRSFSGKAVALMMACVLLLGGVVGGTVAWLTAQDDPVTNIFSTSKIGVELEETTTAYKMIPGWTIEKDPEAWITDGSEAAYLFVEIKESENFDTCMTYAIADGWTLLNSNPALTGSNIVTDNSTADTYVIYREVTTGQMGDANKFHILADDQVFVLETVEAADMPAAGSEPTLTFTAYAHQLYQNEKLDKYDVAKAWENVSGK